jgi:hypothetical protein
MADNILGDLVPENLNWIVEAPYAFGMRFRSATPGDITALRWYVPDTDLGDGRVTECWMRLWDSTGGVDNLAHVVAEKEISADLLGAPVGWMEFPLDDPYLIVEDHTYAVHFDFVTCTDDVIGPWTDSYSVPVVNDNLTLLAVVERDGVPAHSQYPANPSGGINYFVDIVAAAPAVATIDVGADQDTFIGVPVVCTAEAEGNGTLTYTWSKTSGPFGSFANAGFASTTWNPAGGDGTYVLRCTVVDDYSESYDEFTVVVTDPNKHSVPIGLIVDTGWTYVSTHPGDEVLDLGDDDGGTYALSSTNPTGLQLRLGMDEMDEPGAGIDLRLQITADYIDGTSGSIDATLYDGVTLVSTAETAVLELGDEEGDVSAMVEVTFAAADLVGIDWTNLRVLLEATST